MQERRLSSRMKSFLQGRIYFNNRRSTVDCLIRDLSETGARLSFSEAVSVPDAIELYIPNRDETRRARSEWRNGNEMGVSFVDEARAQPGTSEVAGLDIAARLQKLESEVASLRRLIKELKTEGRSLRGECA